MMFKLLSDRFNFLLAIGVSPDDTEDLQLRKITITILPIVIGIAAFLWGLIYLSLGQYLSASVPLSYSFISLLSLIYLYKTKNLLFLQQSQIFLVLFLPFFLMWSLGGFNNGSFVMIWAFFAPIATMVLDKTSKSYIWFYLFLALILISSFIDPWLIENKTNPLPQVAIELFYILNTIGGATGIYFLLKHFIRKSETTLQEKIEEKNTELVKNTAKLFDNISYLQSYKNSIDKNLIVTKTDINGKIIFANDNFYNISGFSENEVIGKTHNIIRHPDNKDSLYANMWNTISSKNTFQGRIKNLKKDGSSYWIETTISPILNKDDEIVEYIAIRHDVTELMNHKDELTTMLYTDQLTGLDNRNALLQQINATANPFLILINIDSFSQINDLYGTSFGNKVLVQFSQILLKHLIHKNYPCKLFRLNGDEFVLLAKNIEHVKLINQLQEFISIMDDVIMNIDSQEISLNFTVGVSYEEKDIVLSTANMALKIARRESKSFIIYDKSLSLNEEYEKNIEWIKKIKDALKEDRIVMFYQAIINNENPSLKKYESLIRLIDSDGNIISPYYFLEIAKKAKLYKSLTKVVIQKSFAAFEHNNFELSVNITVDDILNKETREHIYEMLNKYGVAQRVTFEIVETENIENFQEIESFISDIKSYGCKIAIDDFGTGYSNFEYLMRLQADFIKIDGSITKEILNDKKSELVTTVILAFAKKMNIQVVAEFVENKEIQDKLISLGVNHSQGYYFSEPKANLD